MYRGGPSGKTPRLSSSLGARGFACFLSQGWEERRRLAATQQQLHMQCSRVPSQYLWISDLVDLVDLVDLRSTRQVAQQSSLSTQAQCAQ